MKLPSYKIILTVFFVLFIVLIGILIFILTKNKTNQPNALNVNTPVQNITSIKSASIDIEKIPDEQTKNYVKEAGNISIQVVNYIQDPIKFPVVSNTPAGKYEYNITFTNNGFEILIAPDTTLAANKNLFNRFITQLVLASSRQKFEKNLTAGSLFDKQISDDNATYIDKILNDSNLVNLSIIN